jgi:hypothetical protein
MMAGGARNGRHQGVEEQLSPEFGLLGRAGVFCRKRHAGGRVNFAIGALRSAAAAAESRIGAARIANVTPNVTDKALYWASDPANLAGFSVIFSMFPIARNTSYITTVWSPASIT